MFLKISYSLDSDISKKIGIKRLNKNLNNYLNKHRRLIFLDIPDITRKLENLY